MKLIPSTIERVNQVHVKALRAAGYAVTIMSPSELRGAGPELIENSMINAAWDSIDTLVGCESQEN